MGDKHFRLYSVILNMHLMRAISNCVLGVGVFQVVLPGVEQARQASWWFHPSRCLGTDACSSAIWVISCVLAGTEPQHQRASSTWGGEIAALETYPAVPFPKVSGSWYCWLPYGTFNTVYTSQLHRGRAGLSTTWPSPGKEVPPHTAGCRLLFWKGPLLAPSPPTDKYLVLATTSINFLPSPSSHHRGQSHYSGFLSWKLVGLIVDRSISSPQ
ncbi:hypothetical protein B0H66DRAFT_83167 [Apodospora peruviana]|uniref:Uncharacterized protein n=1 Tax=Apodospora peruviana TaxID=516989 RepID=A0AAE0ITI9_9PEZI|nr:hypothetical protein B0H66DRAFT_83167 [Apodospora peruviana]